VLGSGSSVTRLRGADDQVYQLSLNPSGYPLVTGKLGGLHVRLQELEDGSAQAALRNPARDMEETSKRLAELQAKLLRVLEAGEFERLGSPRTIKVNVRLIAATNRDLTEAIKQGRFREDLYYRLNVFPICVPPLRERPEDIPLLVWAFLDEFSSRMGKKITQVPRKTMEALQRGPWPGNVRELRNVLERALLLARGEELVQPTHLAAEVRGIGDDASLPHVSRSLAEMEKAHIERTLRAHGDNRTRAARELGISRATLIKKIREYELGERPGPGSRQEAR
jgi:transcriptional regulator with PAS, ATPase and Fis domain